jgi:protein-serine/threonine kinase
MQTSCGSPCYAAPELVISDGMYVGSAVDIWSCGVILYAMLAGYLPFDDDPANPDGDNINLLYKYIVNTPLSFPEYISAEARDLLSLMLVPDPKNRADIQTVMNHRWLRPCAPLFNRTLPDLEHAAMEQHQEKRLAYQKQMKAAATAAENQRMARSQSARTDGYANSVGVLPSSTTRSRSHRDYSGSHQQQQVPLYETSNDQPVYTSSPSPQQANATVPSRRTATSQIVLPTSAFGVDDDPFAPTPSRGKPETDLLASSVNDRTVDENTRRRQDSVTTNDATPTSTSKVAATTNGTRKASNAGGPPPDQGQRKKKDDFRHTIQVEYNDNATSESQQLSQSQSSHRQPSQEKQQPIFPAKASEVRTNGTRRVSQSRNDTTPRKPVPQTTTPASTPTSTSDIPKIKALPPTPQNNTPRPRATSRGYTAPHDPVSSSTTQPTIEVTAPLSPTSAQPETNGVSDLNISVNGKGSQSAKTHRTGPSLDKIGLGKFFGTTRSTTDQTSSTARSAVNGPTTMNSRQASESDVPSDTSASGRPRRPSTVQVTTTTTSQSENAWSKSQNSTPGTQNAGGRSPQLLSPVDSSSTSATSSKKSRRNTLTVMVEPLRNIKQRTKSGRGASRDPSSKDKDSAGDKSREPSDSLMNQDPPKTAVLPPHQHQDSKFPEVVKPGVGNAASTSKAKKVMEWFRTKSRGRVPDEEHPITDKSLPTPPSREVPINASTSTINGLTSPVVGSSMNARPPSTNLDVSAPRSAVSTTPGHPTRTPSIATDKSFSNPIKRSFILSPAAKNILRVHHGAMDQTTITSGNPPEVMKHVLDVLLEMGLDVQEESQYKFRCIRPKKRKIGSTGVSLKDGQGGNGLAAFSMVGSAASGGVSICNSFLYLECGC